MKIFCICLIRNEADVIEPCLQAAQQWADRIFLYDGASTDGTWEKVQALRSERIIPWRSDAATFREGLRALVFNDCRGEAQEGDWWCQLNGDEFYLEDPRTFLAAVPRYEHVVWGLMVQYYLTPEDVAAPHPFTGDFARDRELIRYYRVACAERRFFRHRARLVWRDHDAWPGHLGVAHERVLPFAHYPYRSPQQIQMRLDVRREARQRGFEGWDHAKEETWQEKIEPRAGLFYDAHDGRLELTPPLLDEHREPASRRLLKRALHGLGVWP